MLNPRIKIMTIVNTPSGCTATNKSNSNRDGYSPVLLSHSSVCCYHVLQFRSCFRFCRLKCFVVSQSSFRVALGSTRFPTIVSFKPSTY